MNLTQGAQHVLAHGGTIVTANARAARHLHRVNQWMESRVGNSAWPSPNILPLDAWLESIWQSLILSGAEDRLLLSALAEDEIWVRVLREDGAADRVLTVRGLAATTAEAWRLLWGYGGIEDLRSSVASGDARAFAGWAEQYLRFATQNKWMDLARLTPAITQAIARGNARLPIAILFCGFDRVTPTMQRLLTALRQSGCAVELADFGSESVHGDSTKPSGLITAANQTQEIETTAAWCRDTIARDPTKQVALVVPNVREMRDEINHIFQRVLAPATRGILAGDAALPYEFSLGQPLAQYAMIRCALMLLRWSFDAIPLDDISWLLNCEYCGADDLWSRGRADAELRRRGKSLRLDANMHWTIDVLKRSSSNWRAMLQRLGRIATDLHLNQISDLAGYTTWIEAAEQYLAVAGWPGSSALNSVEYQAQKRWQSTLISVAHLDASLPKVSFAEAYAMIERAAQSSLFAPESQNAPIQIIGAVESAGLAADAIWFAGVDELTWPTSQRPNPLLPIHLQRALQVPRTNLAKDLEFAAAVSRRIFSAAPTVFASFARRKDDAELSVSSVVLGLPWQEHLRAEDMPQPISEQPNPETEPLLDRSHVAWSETRAAGGADVLEKQAACPFRAFASKRLHAQPLSEMEEGLGRGDRGNLVHKVMQGFWDEVRSQEQLLSLGEEHSLQTLERHITLALKEHAGPDEWSSAFLAAESDRLKRLLSGWLQIERERSPFSVLEREHKSLQNVGSLTLSLRMDRVDKTPAGHIILDYKTGKAATKDWDGDRPDRPQLPLYALNTENLAGLGFARIATKQTDITAWQREDGVFFPPGDERNDGMTHSLDQDVALWRQVLESLAAEFAEGEARVDPKKGRATCRNCGLETLCRIAEALPFGVGHEVDE